MNNKKFLIGIFMITLCSLLTSCASKKVGCYYGEESAKKITTDKMDDIENCIYHYEIKGDKNTATG